MIEQYTIAATPKYNFPQSTMDLTLPQRFIELSLHSLKHMQNQTFQLNQQTIQQTANNPSQEPLYAILNNSLKPIPLTPRTEETTIAAMDTSSIKLGETSTGIITAIRGTCIWKRGKSYAYLRIGPFIFHITEENLKDVYRALQAAYFPEQGESQGTPNIMQTPVRMANLLEKWLQQTLTKTVSNGLILFDGSLTAGTPDTPTSQLKEILNNARAAGNTVLAFSKMTTLRFNGYLITDTLITQKPPCIIAIPNIKPKPPTVLLGEVYVAKLTRGNCTFRLDIDKETPPEKRVEAVERLIGNDLVTQSYPETLRLAHILCTFTANEVIAMQHFIQHRYRLKIIERPDMHRLLFGPFGKGESHSEAL
ncbi:MAG: hypothetical protein QW658_04055 [Candidatus Bathyarchaeia archaeon]